MTIKDIRLLAIALFLPFITTAQSPDNYRDWKQAALNMPTRWSKEVSPTNALKEYPRPQMVRPNWQNLNGLWDYAITTKDADTPGKYDGQILVPFPLESALSGVKKSLLPTQNLWYRRTFAPQPPKGGARVLLHFGAVDWKATVFINGKQTGEHTGGYNAFTMDITDKLIAGNNEITVKVFDPSDQGIGPHGKQVLNPANIYYTPTSGIWQTVWLETVPAAHINNLILTPNVDGGYLSVTVNSNTNEPVEITGDNKTIKGKANEEIKFPIPNAHLWSPTDPFLYDLTVKMGKDEVKSYFGMRKIAIQKDEKGVDRIFLNNKPYYNLGVLDQGFWPDGLYTAPTDGALAFDIKAIKAMGFNTIRKHIKVEPARWYYHADKIGMLVWQDMVNPNQSLPEGSKPEFEKESAEILEQLHNYPCIITWVLFNEKWGQYDQLRLTEWIKKTDPSRIVNGHTGELLYVNEQLRSPSPNAYVSADMTDVHSYPDPMMPIKQTGKAQVVGEFGGIGVSIPNHQWSPFKGWGYIQVTPAQLQGKYAAMVENLKMLETEGLSGSIYTQPFDVEGEENGLMTYDREVIKIPFEELRKIHSILNPAMGTIQTITAQNSDKTDEGLTYIKQLDEYRLGKREPAFLKNLAMMAIRLNDKPGGVKVSWDYIATLKAPLNEEQVRFISQFTKSTKDPGFALINENQEQFKKIIGDRPLTVNLMNMIYTGEMSPMIEGKTNIDWNVIETKVKPYGAPGDEMLYRAKTIDYFNKQDWANYVPTAAAYLEKYGKNISEKDRTTFSNAISQHQ